MVIRVTWHHERVLCVLSDVFCVSHQVSTDTGELRQALQAYQRILDLKNKFVDVEVCV